MPASASDIHFYRSSNGDSEGGARSPTEIVSGVENNLFPNVSDALRIAGGSMTRKLFAANEHASDPFAAPRVWVPSMPSGVVVTIGAGFDDADDDSAGLADLTAWTAGAALAAVSDGADTRQLQILGVVAGVPTIVPLTLTGASEAVTGVSFSAVYAVMADAKSASRLVTLRQGAGGTVRGTIPVNRGSTFRMYSPAAKADGLWFPDIVAGGSIGIWIKVAWAAGASAVKPANGLLSIEDS